MVDAADEMRTKAKLSRPLAAGVALACLSAASASAAPFRFFSSASFWNRPIADATVDPSSGPMVASLGATIEAEESAKTGPWINTSSYGIPLYTVGPQQPAVSVRLTGGRNPALAAAWAQVPLPASARPAAGSDGILVVWQPSSNRLWEFWRLSRQNGSWQAVWGGAIEHVSSSSGVYGPEAWLGGQSWWGVSASSLSLVGGLITLEDLKAGEINHALAIALPTVRAGVFALPAQRTDGRSADPLALPEGARLRLDPKLNLSTLSLPPLTRMIARAAQSYGIVVTDSSPVAELYAQDPTPTGANPYLGASGYFGGLRPSQLLASFPWGRLQVVRMELRRRR
jgi:hypothetical protein